MLFFLAKVSMAYMNIYGEDYEQGLISYHLNNFVHYQVSSEQLKAIKP